MALRNGSSAVNQPGHDVTNQPETEKQQFIVQIKLLIHFHWLYIHK